MISIIIPALNEEKYIESTLKSVRSQEFDDYEVILVDGKSEDKTREIAKEYVDKIIISPEKSRQFQCNLGAKNTQGDILVFLHADTIMASPDVLSSIAKSLKNPEVVAGSCKNRHDKKELKYKLLEKQREIQRKIFGNMCNGDSAAFFKKDVFDKVNGWDKNILMDDVDITRKVRKYGKIKIAYGLVITSARRFEDDGFLSTLWKWTYASLLLYVGIRLKLKYKNIR